ncbi:MAG: aldo/keto reductase [Chitinophagaceae bacterium]|nr:aldo/keto reductase [Chitinophagaceae bacterium]
MKNKSINRRDFIAKTVLASASTVVGQSLLSSYIPANIISTKSNIKNNKRKLGKLEVSSMGLGGLPVVGFYGGGVREQGFVNKLYAQAYENGITFFDTAEVYGPLTNETQIGEAVRSFRKNIVLATKFGFEVNPNHQSGRGRALNSRPENIRRAVEGSLKRLNTDYIDLYYQHRVDPNVPIEDVAGTIKDLMKEGKVLHWGLSEPGVKTIRRAHAEQPLAAIQNEYSIWTRDYETNVIPLCEELGIGFVPWCPMGYGFLAGSINENTKFGQGDFRAVLPRVKPENIKQNLKLLDYLKEWGLRKNKTAAQISLSWLLTQKPFIVPIPGTSSLDHLLENVNASSSVFSSEELIEFNFGLSKIEIAGAKNTQQIIDAMGVESALKTN